MGHECRAEKILRWRSHENRPAARPVGDRKLALSVLTRTGADAWVRPYAVSIVFIARVGPTGRGTSE